MAEQQAPGVGTVLGEAGGCPEVEYGGRAWKIGHPVQRAKAALEEYLAAEAVMEAESTERSLPPAVYEKVFNNTLDAVRAKHYRTWGKGWIKATEGPEGPYLFLLSLLRVHQPDATVADARALLVNRPLATLAALERVCPDFFSLLAADLPLPPAAQAAKVGEMMAKFFGALKTAFAAS